ncbi:MAG: ABC transporter ATP-binding protein [Acidobacteria bacterium]|nr:ABC transporter ATP-binding protein [Acidobacteriota bacterium]MCB9396389.1 ABC transporter ATP-binding protein [Acidobacteriota bacterium]
MFYELRNVSKSFGSKQVLSDIDLEITRGETTVVLGGSGAGKSVLLKLLIGLIQPDTGEILFEGQDIGHLKESQYYAVRKRVSYLFQGGALFDSMNVLQNLAYPLLAHSALSDEEIRERARESLEMVELENVEHMFPVDLSGGMMKRVALARAIINHPEMILYDEPTTGLDPLTTRTINKLIRKLQRELKVTSVVVTHDMSTADFVADKLSFLHQGEFAFSGRIEEARASDHPLLRAYFWGGHHE